MIPSLQLSPGCDDCFTSNCVPAVMVPSLRLSPGCHDSFTPIESRL